jgi:xylose isomerase
MFIELLYSIVYRLEEKSIVKAKIDSNAIVGASFQHELNSSVKLTLCAEVDAKDWAADSHKFGIGLNFE